MRSRPVNLAIVLVAAVAFVAALAALSPGRAGAKFVISRGGTYTGEFVSDEPGQDVIAITTGEPVIIENATVRGRGHLITSHYTRARVTIRNTGGIGMNPNIAGKCAGRFASIEGFCEVQIENCSMEGTSGIYLLDYAGDGTTRDSICILQNRARNIDGRKSDGKGGYSGAVELVQFLQFDKVRGVAGVAIGWNEVINEPGKSAVEDVISIYQSSGAKLSPIRIHNNFIRGAYPPDPAKDGYSGGGIMLGDGVAGSPDGDSAYVHAYDNHVLDTTNYGIAISAGHDCEFYRNRIVSAGVLPDGAKIAAQNVGAYIWDSYKAGEKRFYNNSGRDNLSGWVKQGGRNDWWTPHATTWQNNEHWPGPITADVYEQEWKRWQEKIKSDDTIIGPATRPTVDRPAPALP